MIPDIDNVSIVGELFNFSGGYVVGPSFSSYPSRGTTSIWRIDRSFQTTIMVENTAAAEDHVTLKLYSDRAAYEKTFTIGYGRVREKFSRRSLISYNSSRELVLWRIGGTPTFFVGKVDPNGDVTNLKMIMGTRPYEVFKSAIEDALGAKN